MSGLVCDERGGLAAVGRDAPKRGRKLGRWPWRARQQGQKRWMWMTSRTEFLGLPVLAHVQWGGRRSGGLPEEHGQQGGDSGRGV